MRFKIKLSFLRNSFTALAVALGWEEGRHNLSYNRNILSGFLTLPYKAHRNSFILNLQLVNSVAHLSLFQGVVEPV